jgi:predicted component of type VI protein secretion system
MRIGLVVLTAGKKKGWAIPIAVAEFLIGRSAGCHLRPKSRIFSDRHCALITRDGRLFVRDLGSANGTYVNQKPVRGELELHDQDRLRVGFLSFAVHIQGETPPTTLSTAPALAAGAVEASLEASPPAADEEFQLVPLEEVHGSIAAPAGSPALPHDGAAAGNSAAGPQWDAQSPDTGDVFMLGPDDAETHAAEGADDDPYAGLEVFNFEDRDSDAESRRPQGKG